MICSIQALQACIEERYSLGTNMEQIASKIIILILFFCIFYVIIFNNWIYNRFFWNMEIMKKKISNQNKSVKNNILPFTFHGHSKNAQFRLTQTKSISKHNYSLFHVYSL